MSLGRSPAAMRWRTTIRAGARVTGRVNTASGSASTASSGWKAPSTRASSGASSSPALPRSRPAARLPGAASSSTSRTARAPVDVTSASIARVSVRGPAGDGLEAVHGLEPEPERLLDGPADVGARVLRGGGRRHGERERGGERRGAAAAHRARPRGRTSDRQAHGRDGPVAGAQPEDERAP